MALLDRLRATPPRRLVVGLLLAVVVLGGALRAGQAATPGLAYESPDEASYGKLAKTLSRDGEYGDDKGEPLHWPPGAPYLFALADRMTPTAPEAKRSDIPAAYWLQALVSTALIPVVFALAALLAGPVAGLLAALAVAVYPPLIYTAGELMSEPLGAFLLATATLAAFVGLTRPTRWTAAAFPAAGVLYGLAVLTRTDLLFVIGIAAGVVGLARWRAGSWRSGAWAAGSLALAGVLTLVPWALSASKREGSFVPVTTGGGSALFVGTYLPGGGTTVGLKYDLADELRRRHPQWAGRKTYKIPASLALRYVAERHPGLSQEAALQREGRRNLVRYGLGQPVAFTRMVLAKVKRMWLFYYRGGGRHYILPGLRAYHVALVLLSALGLLAGLIRARDPRLWLLAATVAYGTVLHAVFVSQARYNLPLLPLLVAGGAAGAVLALRSRGAAADVRGGRARFSPAGPAPVAREREPQPETAGTPAG